MNIKHSNIDIFNFKQFQVAQNQNVHRVGTDGVLLGAWVNVQNTSSILDIGTGTGVIALMLAQRAQASVVGIETNYEAFSIAQQNFLTSPFQERTKAYHTSLQDFHPDKLFDLIVCNPPYFENSQKPPTIHRQQQRHNDTLSSSQLIAQSVRLLRESGKLAVVLPVSEGNRFIQLAQVNFFLSRACAVFSKAGKPQERWLLEFNKQADNHQHHQTKLCIMDPNGQWTDEYKQLTTDFYLNF